MCSRHMIVCMDYSCGYTLGIANIDHSKGMSKVEGKVDKARL